MVSAKDKERMRGCIRAGDKGRWFTVCKVVLQVVNCSAMQAEIRVCELLLRTLNDLLKDGACDYGDVEMAVKGTGARKNEGGREERYTGHGT